MKVEKVPDSTYDVIGGLDQQIKEIKEVIELPLKHPVRRGGENCSFVLSFIRSFMLVVVVDAC